MTELIWDCMTPVLQISRLCCYLVFMPFFAVECSLCVCVCVCVCVLCRGGHLDHLLYTAGAGLDQGILTVTVTSDAPVFQFTVFVSCLHC